MTEANVSSQAAVAGIFIQAGVEIERHVLFAVQVVDSIPSGESLGHAQSFHSMAVPMLPTLCRREPDAYLPAKRGRRARQRGQGQTGVGIIEQAIERSPAGVHAFRQFGFRDPLQLHFLGNLPGDDALQGYGRGILKHRFFLEEFIEAAAKVLFSHAHLLFNSFSFSQPDQGPAPAFSVAS